jgi:hypothetical protein
MNSPLHVMKTRAHKSVDQLHHHVQTEETDNKNVFLQLDHVPLKHELLLPYTATVVKILWLFVQMFSKHQSPELKSFL